MEIHWGVFWAKSRNPLKAAWLITAGLVALYLGFIQPREMERGVALEKGTGLAAVAGSWQPMSLWRQSRLPLLADANKVAYERVGPRSAVATYLASDPGNAAEGRKLVTTSSIGLVVKNPPEAAEQITKIAERNGGFLVTSQVNTADLLNASLSIRVPAAKFEGVRSEIRKLGLRVESESTEAQDVTKQYVDEEARLRNLRAEEEQYLLLLHKATSVKDTLEVSDKLNETRGAIEEKQAEFVALSKQVETVAMSVALRAEEDAQVFGLHWRPLYELKIAVRGGLNGVGDYVASMTAFIFYLPTILLWLFTILVVTAVAWRILRWAAKALFRSKSVAGETIGG